MATVSRRPSPWPPVYPSEGLAQRSPRRIRAAISCKDAGEESAVSFVQETYRAKGLNHTQKVLDAARKAQTAIREFSLIYSAGHLVPPFARAMSTRNINADPALRTSNKARRRVGLLSRVARAKDCQGDTLRRATTAVLKAIETCITDLSWKIDYRHPIYCLDRIRARLGRANRSCVGDMTGTARQAPTSTGKMPEKFVPGQAVRSLMPVLRWSR